MTDQTTLSNEVATVDADEPMGEPTDQSTDPDRTESAQPCAEQPLALRVEALLLATDRPLSEPRLAELLGIAGKGSQAEVREAIDELNRDYESTGRSFRVERLAGGYQIMTLQAFGPLLARFHTDRQHTRLSQAALETLAIIAYRQPIMRAEIEAIRGVACGEVLRGLLERRLITIAGRAEELGRPMLYGTTREFLKVFGLAGLDDLPTVEGLDANAASPKQRTAASASGESETTEQHAANEASSSQANDAADAVPDEHAATSTDEDATGSDEDASSETKPRKD